MIYILAAIGLVAISTVVNTLVKYLLEKDRK